MTRLDQTIAQMGARLSEIGIDTARLDARLLVQHALCLTDTDIIVQFDRTVSDEEQCALLALMERRLKREPMAHILGEREFWGLPFRVTADTLVPRPDSETLVKAILDSINNLSATLTIVDIGTGSGCLLLSLLSELPNAFGLGTDINEATLAVARQNASDLGLSQRCAFMCGNYGEALGGGIDILISNPPYLAASEMADLQDDVALYDPHRALVSGDTGLEAYETIFKSICNWPDRPKLMAFEFGYKQANDIEALAEKTELTAFEGCQSLILKDLGDRDRVLLVVSSG